MRQFVAQFQNRNSPLAGFGFLIFGAVLAHELAQYVIAGDTTTLVGAARTLIVELGIVSLISWIIVTVAVVWSCWKVVKKLKRSTRFPLAFVIFWHAFLLLVPFTFNGLVSYQNFVQNAYLWLLIGILFRLPHIALSSQYAAVETSAAIPRRWVR
jgi:hypothetical protein